MNARWKRIMLVNGLMFHGFTRNPLTPSSINSGIEPRRNAITGVPVAIASTTDKPNGLIKLMRCSKAAAPPNNASRCRPPTEPT